MFEDEPLLINCCTHGRRVASVVCAHMIDAPQPVGFIENNSDPDDLQAWCDRCESFYLSEGDKTPAFEAFNDMAIVCCHCYTGLKQRHSTR